jgi:hypothetical protein
MAAWSLRGFLPLLSGPWAQNVIELIGGPITLRHASKRGSGFFSNDDYDA